MKRPATIIDVAYSAGVSLGTVSNVLNGRISVRKEVKERVNKAIRELGFTPSMIATGMRKQRSNVIGLCVPFTNFQNFSLLADAVERISAAAGYELMQVYSGASSGDETKQFVAMVLAETEDVWTSEFQTMGRTYEDPTLTIFSGSIASGCGTVATTAGPTYCASDRKVYLDPDYFEQLADQGITGDFAEPFLIAREADHHVQNLTGILTKFDQLQPKMDEHQASLLAVRIQWQADCFAGV